MSADRRAAVGDLREAGAVRLELPVIPAVATRAPAFLPPVPHDDNAPGRYLESVSWPRGFYRFTQEAIPRSFN
jgi:hypothetical protein